MTSSVRTAAGFISWTPLSSSSALWKLRNVSYAVGGAAFFLIGILWIRARKNTHLKIDSEWFCRRRHITLLKKGHECINDSIYLRFDKKFAQGIIKIELENLISPKLKTLYLYCRYNNTKSPHNGHYFEFQRIPIEQLSDKLFIQNLPYREEVTLQIYKTEDRDEKPLWEKTLKVTHALAEYLIKADNGTPTLSVQPCGLPQGFQPVSSLIPLNEPVGFIIEDNKILPSALTPNDFVFENKNSHMIKLNLEFSFDPALCYVPNLKVEPRMVHRDSELFFEPESKKAPMHVMIPVIIDPRSTRKLSQEFILQRFRDVFLRAVTTRLKMPPENPSLRLTNIQLISYFPENHGK